MTDIEKKALALLKGADYDYELGPLVFKRDRDVFSEALCRAIEQHEAFRQEVSDAVTGYFQPYDSPLVFQHFIIPAAKPDPLVEVVQNVGLWAYNPERNWAGEIRSELDALGFEIREKNDD